MWVVGGGGGWTLRYKQSRFHTTWRLTVAYCTYLPARPQFHIFYDRLKFLSQRRCPSYQRFILARDRGIIAALAGLSVWVYARWFTYRRLRFICDDRSRSSAAVPPCSLRTETGSCSENLMRFSRFASPRVKLFLVSSNSFSNVKDPPSALWDEACGSDVRVLCFERGSDASGTNEVSIGELGRFSREDRIGYAVYFSARLGTPFSILSACAFLILKGPEPSDFLYK